MAESSDQRSYFDLPKETQWAGYVALGFVLFVIWDQWYWWGSRDDYSFGYLVPVFVGYVLFERWPEIYQILLGAPGSEGESEHEKVWVGWRIFWGVLFGAAFFLGLLVFLFGAVLRATQGVQNPASLSIAWGFAWFLLSLVYLINDRRADGAPVRLQRRLRLTALFLFPAFIWLISAPLLNFIERGLSLFLLDKVTAVVFLVFEILGIPIQKEGNVLVLGFLEGGRRNEVMVEDACSGIRSLMACLFAGSFLGAVFMKPVWKKVLLVGLAMLFAFFTNILRSLFLTAWAYRNGADSIAGAVHDITGYAVLGLTCVGLIALLPLINFQYSLDALDEEDASSEATDTS